MTRIKVPATIANIGPGFDTLGMAVRLYNHFEAQPAETLSVIVGPGTCIDVSMLDLDPDRNLLARAYRLYFERRDRSLIPATLMIDAHIPLSRGLGSSSSAIVGGFVLANAMTSDPLPREDLLPWAITMEGHPDNVTPALFGGVHCCLPHGRSIRLTWPEAWPILLVIPPSPVSTAEARSQMPDRYPITDIVNNIQALGAWIYGLDHQDADCFRQALGVDRLHEPYRGRLIPEYAAVQEYLAGTHALGGVISGSGSTMAVFFQDEAAMHATRALLQQHALLGTCRIFPVTPDVIGTSPTTQDNPETDTRPGF